MDLGLQRVQAVWRTLCEAEGLSQNAVVITVAGTNGKGSTCAMLEAMLLAAGYKVGLHTSPHIKDFRERARINGRWAEEALLVEGFEAVQRHRGDISLTYFEFSLLAILFAFHRNNLDVWIMEIGLGGRLDAVNMLEPDCSILTNVDIDHAQLLGDTREKIGIEKAAIFRKNKPAIYADPAPVSSVLESAKALGADLWLFGRDFNYQGDKQQWSFAGRDIRRNSLAYPALRGANQLLNASAALAALNALGQQLPMSQQAIRQGLAQVELPGRFQVLPGQPTVILDVGHNPHAASHLAANLDQMSFYPYTYAVFGILADKDIDGVIRRIAHKIDHWYLCDTDGARGFTAEHLQLRLEAVLGKTLTIQSPGIEQSIQCFKSSRLALAAARKNANENDRIVVFGSFLVVADVI